MSKTRALLAAALITVLSATGFAYGGDDNGKHLGNPGPTHPCGPGGKCFTDEGPGLDLGRPVSSSVLVRAQDVGADPFTLLPLPPGTDGLDSGQVAVRDYGKVAITLKGALPSQSYDVWFCRYTMTADRCALLGKAMTDATGSVHSVVDFTLSGSAFTGVFAVARNNAIQYLSGFSAPAQPAPVVSIALSGEVAAVDLTNMRFTLQGSSLMIYVDSSTIFQDVTDLSGIKATDEVVVRGVLRADGSVLAAMVRLK
jgi:hypothetical protein